MTTCPKCGVVLEDEPFRTKCPKCDAGFTVPQSLPPLEPIRTEREKGLESLFKHVRAYIGAFECEFTLNNLPAHAKACRDLQDEIEQALNQPDGEKKD